MGNETLSCLGCICAVKDDDGKMLGCLDYADQEDCEQDQQDEE
jgi:hypothetical protein